MGASGEGGKGCVGTLLGRGEGGAYFKRLSSFLTDGMGGLEGLYALIER